MNTECPNPKCKALFEVPDERQGKNGPCPACGQVITFRSLQIIREVQRQHAKRTSLQGAQLPGETPVAFSALLEDIRSLWNVGSIFRSADGAGFTKLYLCGITGSPEQKAATKTSLGAEAHIAWAQHTSALEVLPDLVLQGVQIVILEKTEHSESLGVALARNAIKTPLCLVVGNEVAGVSAESLSLAALTCHLPMFGVKTSLNVAVAFGIAAYRIRESVIS